MEVDVQSHSGTVLGFLSEFRRLQSASPAMQTHGQRITNGGLTRGGVIYHHNRNPTCLVRSVLFWDELSQKRYPSSLVKWWLRPWLHGYVRLSVCVRVYDVFVCVYWLLWSMSAWKSLMPDRETKERRAAGLSVKRGRDGQKGREHYNYFSAASWVATVERGR